jgi:hypothetical protein
MGFQRPFTGIALFFTFTKKLRAYDISVTFAKIYFKIFYLLLPVQKPKDKNTELYIIVPAILYLCETWSICLGDGCRLVEE